MAQLLSVCPVERLRDPAQAVELANQAVEHMPQRLDYRAILGIALYRAGDWKSCVAALEDNLPRAHDPTRGCGLFQAMAYWQLGDRVKASQTYDQTIRWLKEVRRPSAELRRFRVEAEGLLGLMESGE